ncbi:MAG: NAD-dependent epimerase/dehydratase family protein [Planctomycetota bacterium]
MQQRYVVTGGAGFIGSHVVARLFELGHGAVVLDNFSTGKRSNLEEVQAEHPDGDLRVIDGSITSPGDVAAACDGASGVVHLAALPSVVRSVEAPLESHEHNVTGTVNVLDVARQNGVRVVYAGSSSAYGDQDVQFKHEELRESPLSPYAASKLAGELYCRSFSRVYDHTSVVTRFFNVFGPRQVPDSPYSGVVAAFCFAVLNGTQPRIDGDGSQSRDFTYVGDVARGVVDALTKDLPIGCHTVNLAAGGNHSINELLQVLKDYASSDIEPNYAPPRNGDVKHSQADANRVKELLGFEAEVSFVEGLQRTFDWYRKTYATETSR